MSVQEEKPRRLVGGGHFVQADVAGNGQIQGYRWLHLRAVQRGCVVSQEAVRQLIKSLDPEGAALRRETKELPRQKSRHAVACGLVRYAEAFWCCHQWL